MKRFASLFIFVASCSSTKLAPRSPASEASCDHTAGAMLEHVVRSNDFTVWRDLGEYRQMLGAGFVRRLAALSDVSQWIDMGGGEGRALKGFYAERRSSGRKPRLALISYAVQDSDFPSDPQFRVLDKRFVEDIPDAEIGTARLMTDIYGPMAYSARPDEVMAKYLRLLEEEGELFWVPGSHEYLDWGLRSDMRGFVQVGSEQVPLHEWIKQHLRAGGFVVAEEKHAYVQPARGWRREAQEVEVQVLRITKRPGARLHLPKLKLVLSDESKRPPLRHFEIVPNLSE